MIVALAVGLLGLGLLIAAYAVSSGRREKLQRRLSLIASQKEGAGRSGTQSADERGQERGLDHQIRKGLTLGMRHTWGANTNISVLLIVAAVGGGIAWLIAYRGFGLAGWLSGALTAAGAYAAPRAILSRAQKKAEKAFGDIFPDALDTIVRMLRAGLPMSQAVRSVGVEGQPPVSTVFAEIDNQTKIGIPLERALEVSSREIGMMDYRFFAVAVLLQHATGGNLAGTLELLSGIVRKRRALRLKAHAATAEIRLTAYVLAAVPFLSVGALLVIQPNYLAPLIADRRGHTVLAAAGVLLCMAFFVMWRMARSVMKV
jgi:tight adherence protein B